MKEWNTDRIPDRLCQCGVAGAGGAGFPTYTKWTDLGSTPCLLVNHEESEPNYYSDKWLMHHYSDAYVELFEALLGTVLDLIVVGAKKKYRDPWMKPLEQAMDASVYYPDELPLNPQVESGLVIAYTDPLYELSQEPSLLWTTVEVQIGADIPKEHGWIVQNSETVFNIHQALKHNSPVIEKYVHVDGETPRHRHLHVPIGTPAERLLREAELTDAQVGDKQEMMDGGPGWCSEVEKSPENYGVTKRTNAIMVLEKQTVESHRDDFEEHRINALEARDWEDRDHEVEPTDLTPDRVLIPLINNPSLSGTVTPSRPVVSEGKTVQKGDLVAEPEEGISLPQHASMEGVVRSVTEKNIVIEGS